MVGGVEAVVFVYIWARLVGVTDESVQCVAIYSKDSNRKRAYNLDIIVGQFLKFKMPVGQRNNDAKI